MKKSQSFQLVNAALDNIYVISTFLVVLLEKVREFIENKCAEFDLVAMKEPKLKYARIYQEIPYKNRYNDLPGRNRWRI